MPRLIARWTIAAAAAGLMAVPAAAFAQSTGSSQPPSQPPASQSAAAPGADQNATPADHVREAKQALDNIPKSSIPAADHAKFAQLRTHLNKLEQDVAARKPSAKSTAKSGSPQWAGEMAAIDKLLTELVGPEGSSAPSATGTTGSAAPSAAKSTQLDDQAQNGLKEVRRHITALASEMSGTASPTPSAQDQATGSSAASSADTMGTPPSGSSQAASANSTQSSTSTQSAQSASSSATGSSSTTPPAQSGTQSSVTQPPASSSQTPSSAAPSGDQAGQPNEAAAKQHLTEARDSLSALTKMPEASKLQGESRTNVSQLISDFNELITTQSNWRDSDQKVEGDLDKLLGSDNGAAPATPAGTTGSANSSATGTTGNSNPPAAVAGQQPSAAAAGSAELDPAIRAKLVEFRSHLKDFEQAAGGATPSAAVSSTPSASTASPVSTSSSAMNPAVSTGSTSNPANPATAANPASSSAASAAAGSPSSPAGTPGAAGTSGSATPQPTGTTGSSATPTASASMGTAATSNSLANRTEIERHLDAIQSLLDQSKSGKLDKAQTDQLKSEVQQLRQLLGQSK